LSSEWCSAIPSPGKSARALFLVRNGAQIFLDVGGKKGMPDNRVLYLQVLCTRSLYISSHTWPNFLFWRQSRRGAMAAEAAESAEMQLVFAPSFSDADYKLVELDEDALQELLNDNGRRVAHIPVARPTLPKLLLLMSPAAACLSIQGPPVKPPLTDVAPTLLAASLSRARSKTRRYFAPPSAATGFAGRIPLTLSCSPPVRSRWANLGAVKTVSPLSMERILPQR